MKTKLLSFLALALLAVNVAFADPPCAGFSVLNSGPAGTVLCTFGANAVCVGPGGFAGVGGVTNCTLNVPVEAVFTVDLAFTSNQCPSPGPTVASLTIYCTNGGRQSVPVVMPSGQSKAWFRVVYNCDATHCSVSPCLIEWTANCGN
jgi:hypothetical protein